MSASEELFEWLAFAMAFDALLVFGGEHFFQFTNGKNDVNLD